MVEKKYVDVNVFIYWLANHPEYGEKAREWIRRIKDSRRGAYITSALTIYELIVILAGLAGKNMRDRKLVKTIVESTTMLPGLEIVVLRQEDHIKALELLEKYNIDYEDAIHLATALRSKATIILSNDKDFDKAPLKRIF